MKKHRKPDELTQEQFDQLMLDLEEFNETFFQTLAGSENYEVVPTVTDMGKPLTKEQYTYVKSECSRLGLAVIYKVDKSDGTSMYINLQEKKIGFIDEGIH